jgi:hypothetical protein
MFFNGCRDEFLSHGKSINRLVERAKKLAVFNADEFKKIRDASFISCCSELIREVSPL